MDKLSYPQGYYFKQPDSPYNLKKWKETAMKIEAAVRRYRGYYDRDQILEHFAKDWDKKEREHFQRWLTYNKKYKRGSAMANTKVAYDPFGNKEQRLTELKSKLRSRINSVERLLNTMADEELLDPQQLLYIGRVLQKLKEEITMLRHPQMVEACCKKATVLLKKAGFTEGVELLNDDFRFAAPIKKIAQVSQDQIQPVIDALKHELDIFDYAKHLRTLMNIAHKLDDIGRHSEANEIINVIKKDLNGLDSIHKRLAEVYLAIGQIPVERKEVPQASQPAQQPQTFSREELLR